MHLLRQGGQVEAEAVVDQHREVARRGLEALDVLDEEQRLEQPDRQLVVEVALGDVDRALSGGLQRGADAGEHVVEGREPADLDVADVLGDLLDDAEHRALTDRAVAALEDVVVRDALDRGLEERELVADERVGADEVRLVGVVAVGLRAVDEVEQRLEVR